MYKMKKIYNTDNINFLEIKDLLQKGKLIVYPTDTVYGVGGIINSEEAIKNIYKAKERSFESPLIVLLSDIKKIEEIAYIPNKNRELVEKLIAKFWPGGLTIILKKKEWVPDVMTANKDTVGLRMPALDMALDIIKSAGGLLPTTSANISGESTPRSYDELSEIFKRRVDILVDGGSSPIGEESTIIDMTDIPKILRVGAISVKDIEKVIGKI